MKNMTAPPKSSVAARMFVLPRWNQLPRPAALATGVQAVTRPPLARPRRRRKTGSPMATKAGLGSPWKLGSWSKWTKRSPPRGSLPTWNQDESGAVAAGPRQIS